MANYQKVKGTQDFYGEAILKMRYIEKVASKMVTSYGFKEIKLPTFENTEVFTRLGEESDVVTKEMYTFKDKGDRSITLRPEGTAGVARSFIENKVYANNLPYNKFFYFGPMFRYERPQAGRYREFNQFGVEVYGDITPLLDADVIISAYNVFKTLGIKNFKLKINSIGDFESRKNYSQALNDYFATRIDKMCEDCGRRLLTNPLRILDCKVDSKNPVLLEAPKINDYLTLEARNYFQEVLKVLDRFGIKYEVDYNLVRGLDYYTDTVFEFLIESNDELNGLAICAGGKYADLLKSMSGLDIPGTGYAFGVERIMAVMDAQNIWPDVSVATDVLVMGLDPESKLLSLEIANTLRKAGFVCELDYKNTAMKNQFKLADKLNVNFIIIIGEEERINNVVTIKDTRLKTQETINIKDIVSYLKGKLQ